MSENLEGVRARFLADEALYAGLRSLGYDVEAPRAGDPAGGSVTARRDLEDRDILLTLDSGGRFRITITWLVGEWPSRQEISGVPARIVDRVLREVTLAGSVDDPAQLVGLAANLGQLVSWASTDAGGETPPPE